MAACTGGHAASPVSGSHRPTVSNGYGPLAIRHSSARRGVEHELRGNSALVLSPYRLEFAMGGSGSCTPYARAASVSRGTLVIPVESAGQRRGCTLDLVEYTVVVTLNQPLLAGPKVQSLRTGYGESPKLRLRLART
jgi:hypothetical protein